MKDTQVLLEEINKDIKSKLSEKRYEHSIGVMKKIGELAKKYNVDINRARLVGIAHDIAKEMSTEDKLRYVKEHNIEIDEIEQINVELLHTKIGADICKNKYGFEKKMQDAIKYHTTGNPNMDDLAKILLIADKTENGRTYIDFAKIEKLEEKGINELLIYVLDESIKFTIDKGKIIHPDSIYTRNAFLLKCYNSQQL